MIDIVIPLGAGSKWQDNELRFALRSIEKNATNYRDIYIIGTKPSWLQNIIHIPCNDKPGRKEFSIFNKTMQAVNNADVSKTFLFTNDDIFFLKPVDIENLPYYHNGNIVETAKRVSGHYSVAVSNVIKTYSTEMNYFDIHLPILYSKKRYSANVAERDWTNKEYVIKSLYCGMMDGEYMKDCKINKPLNISEIATMLSERTFFSLGDYGISPAMKSYLITLFPQKSKYEL